MLGRIPILKLGQILTQDVATGGVKVLDKSTVDGSNPDPTSGVGIRPSFWGRNPTQLLGSDSDPTSGVGIRPACSESTTC